MSAPNMRSLALHVALPGLVDDAPGRCVAWIDSADRICGKPAEYLCSRHVKVAQRRRERAVVREAQRHEKRQAYIREHEPIWRARLARVEARLDQIDPLRTEPFSGDTAMVNLPLSKRLPSDSRIHELAVLHEEAADLRRKLGMGAEG